MVQQLEALVRTFEQATRQRKLSTLLYEDPDAVTGLKQDERDLLKTLNEKVRVQPDLIVPEGFFKVKEKVPVYNYSVPKAALPVVGEAKAACVEVLDDLVSRLFDIHVLEPVVTVQEQYRVKPTIRRPAQEKNRSGRADVLGII